MANKILLTGVTGYLGLKLLRELLACQDDIVLVPLRGATEEIIAARKATILSTLPCAEHAKVQFVEADLGNLASALAPERASIRQIIHSAAVTAFNVEEDVANAVNRDGAIAMMHMARECAGLEKFVYVSTLYASGLASGVIAEQFFSPRPVFANHYERSKWEAEEALRTRFMDLPWNIARVGTVIADNAGGLVVQQNAIHNTLKLFYYGLISIIPGLSTSPIYLVEGDFVSKSLYAISRHAAPRQIFHVSHDVGVALPLGELVDIAFAEFSRDELFRSRRFLKPLFVDEPSFDVLSAHTKSFGGGVLSQAVASVVPFAKQLFVMKDIRNDNLVGLLAGYRAPDMAQVASLACRHLVQTQFAKPQ